MKKVFASMLAIALAASMAVPAFADKLGGDVPTGNTVVGTSSTELTTSPSKNNGVGDYTIGVDGTYVAGTAAAEKISVDIAWESMSFTYDMGKGQYDAANHKTTYPNAAWSTNTADITVTNHSNTAMSAGFSFKAAVDGIKGVLTKESVLIENANQEKYQTNTGTEEAPTYDAPKASTTFSIDPTSSAITTTGSLGTITVTLAKYDGFVYDATEATDQDTLQNALTAAIQAGETKLAVLGDPSDLNLMYALRKALEHAAAGTIELTLQDVTTIGDSCFDLASVKAPVVNSLKTVNLPNVTTIGQSAFYGCTNLTSVTAPKLTSVGTWAFASCDSLTSLTFGTPVTAWGLKVLDEVDTSNVTLTVANGQKTFEGDNTNGWSLTETDLTAGTGAQFCGYTFKEIIISTPATANP